MTSVHIPRQPLPSHDRTGAPRPAAALRVLLAVVFAVCAFSSTANAQSFWANNGCHYVWTGSTYTPDLCRRLVAAYTYDYWNPVQGQWLVRIEDNPANLYQDWTFLSGPSYAWTARIGTARPGQPAVLAGIWAVRNPWGVWTNTIASTGDTAAGQAARAIGTYLNNALNNALVSIWLQ